MYAMPGTGDGQPQEEEAVYVLLELEDLQANGQVLPGQTIELSVRT
jgi:hypothetical protein